MYEYAQDRVGAFGERLLSSIREGGGPYVSH